MDNRGSKKETALIFTAIFIGGIIMAVDLMIPLGVAGGVPYVGLVLLGLWSPDKRFTLLAAFAGSALTVFGFYLSPPGGELWKVIFNRSLALFIIWMTAILCLRYKRSENELNQHREQLEELVKKRTQALHESNQQLENYQNRLEEIVQIRTKELEETNRQLIHSEKLSATGKLAASIAHEFNNPICGIRNTLERILEKVPMDNSHESTTKIAINECNRVAKLIIQLNDFHRPSTGVIESFDIHKTIDEIALLFQKKLKDRNIKLKKNYCQPTLLIKAIPDQIKQVILNLMQNAEESFIENQGEIVITTEKTDSKIKINIKDFGQGIPENNLDKIFDPFFTTKSDVKGIGLGLSVSYGIVENHGGAIAVDSKLGEGTRFILTLPLAGKTN
jgi:signal transduction histidine kinase